MLDVMLAPLAAFIHSGPVGLLTHIVVVFVDALFNYLLWLPPVVLGWLAHKIAGRVYGPPGEPVPAPGTYLGYTRRDPAMRWAMGVGFAALVGWLTILSL